MREEGDSMKEMPNMRQETEREDMTEAVVDEKKGWHTMYTVNWNHFGWKKRSWWQQQRHQETRYWKNLSFCCLHFKLYRYTSSIRFVSQRLRLELTNWDRQPTLLTIVCLSSQNLFSNTVVVCNQENNRLELVSFLLIQVVVKTNWPLMPTPEFFQRHHQFRLFSRNHYVQSLYIIYDWTLDIFWLLLLRGNDRNRKYNGSHHEYHA